MIIKLDFMLQSFRKATSAVDQFVVLGLNSAREGPAGVQTVSETKTPFGGGVMTLGGSPP